MYARALKKVVYIQVIIKEIKWILLTWIVIQLEYMPITEVRYISTSFHRTRIIFPSKPKIFWWCVPHIRFSFHHVSTRMYDISKSWKMSSHDVVHKFLIVTIYMLQLSLKKKYDHRQFKVSCSSCPGMRHFYLWLSGATWVNPICWIALIFWKYV